MRQIRFSVLILFLIIIFFSLAKPVTAMNDPELINWRTRIFNVFAVSAFRAVFGTDLTRSDWAFANRFRAKNNRYELFLALISSKKYKAMYGHLEKKYSIWWDTRLIETNSGKSLCHCYYFSDFSHGGYPPNLQYIHKPLPGGWYNYGVARALTIFCSIADKYTCPHYDCGMSAPNPTNNANELDYWGSSGNRTDDAANIYSPNYDPNRTTGGGVVEGTNRTTDGGVISEIKKSSWPGTWSVRSLHKSGPVKGRRFSSKFRVVINPNSSYVLWNKDKWNCIVSGNTLKFNGKHPSGGKMSWTFVRNGNTLITNRSTFKGTIRGKYAWGTYEGSKTSKR